MEVKEKQPTVNFDLPASIGVHLLRNLDELVLGARHTKCTHHGAKLASLDCATVVMIKKQKRIPQCFPLAGSQVRPVHYKRRGLREREKVRGERVRFNRT